MYALGPAAECTLVSVVLIMVLAPILFPPPTQQAPGNAAARPCNIRSLDARSLRDDELASRLASSAEPLLVRGFAARWPCASIDGCVQRYGDMAVAFSDGATIGKLNPERALDAAAAATNGPLTVHEFTAAMRNRSIPAHAYVFYGVHGTALASDFVRLKALFGRLQGAQQPELARLAMTAPDLAEIVANA